MRPDTVSKQFRKATRALGLDVSFHGLRHGYATLALSAGVPLKHTQMLLGHSSFAVTSDLYSHVSERADSDAASRLDALLFPVETGR